MPRRSAFGCARRWSNLLAGTLTALFLCGWAFAQPSIETYLRDPEFRAPRLSPDGTQLAVLVPAKGRMNLANIDLATRKPVLLTTFSQFDVADFHWVGNERLVFTLGHFNSAAGESYGGGGLYTVKRDGSESRELAPTIQGVIAGGGNVYRPLGFVRSVPGSNDEIVVLARERSVDSVDLYRMNVRTSRKTLITADPPAARVTGWLMDTSLLPRVALAREETSLKTTIYYRAGADAKWEVLTSFDAEAEGAFVPVWIDADSQTILVRARSGDTSGIHRYDIASRKVVERIAVHPRYDMTGASLVFDVDGRRILGYQLEAERYQVSWVDDDHARTQAMVDKALPDRVNKLQRRPAAGRTLVTSYSDRQPDQYFLLDERKRAMEELFASRPWLKPDDLVEMRPFLLKTRDGLQIPSYYLLPKTHKAGQRLPTVISIHGGPQVRSDFWGFESRRVVEAQLLASRGYAVVLPNFRITPGLGDRIHRSGFRQVGRKMQEDHEDATHWAVEQGFADPERICIAGASYGGYAALMGVVKTPGLYRCSIAGFAVTDFGALMDSTQSIYNYDKATPAAYRLMVGDPVKEADVFRDIAPARNAEKIVAPVFLISGGADPIVPIEQPNAMQRALERAGKPVRVLVKPDEGHGFFKLENRVEEFTQVFDFLERHMGAKSTPK